MANRQTTSTLVTAVATILSHSFAQTHIAQLYNATTGMVSTQTKDPEVTIPPCR
jgi:hypothetical protein